MLPTPPKRGFTLIELLVVLSIIALLVAILLPALGKARIAAQLMQSKSNMHQIGNANAAYGADHDGKSPGQWIGRNGGDSRTTWMFGGKFCSSDWAGESADLAPSARSLNEYLYPGQNHAPVTGPPTFGQTQPSYPASESERDTSLDLPIFKDPRDTTSYQGSVPWWRPLEVSAYDDVGTSYFISFRWVYDLDRDDGDPYERGNQIFAQGLTDSYNPSRFLMYSDEIGDVARDATNSVGYDWQIPNDYDGRPGFSVVGFADGHVDFVEVVPRAASTDDYDTLLR